MCTEFNTSNAKPGRTTNLKDKSDLKCTKSKTNNKEPKHAIPKGGRDEPSQAKLLRGNKDPECKKSEAIKAASK